MIRRGAIFTATAAIAILAGSLALSAAPASALSKHAFTGAFGTSGPVPLTNPSDVAVERSSGDIWVANTPEDSHQALDIDAEGGTFTLTFNGQTTGPIAIGTYEAAENIERALEGLSDGGAGNVQVFPLSETNFLIIFEGARGDAEQPQLTADPSGLHGGASTVSITTIIPGADAADIEKFTPSGEFILIAGKGVNKTKLETAGSTEAEQDLCSAASGDACQPGTRGAGPGAYDGTYNGIQGAASENGGGYLYQPDHHLFLAVDQISGDLYVGDPADGVVTKLDPQGALVTSWGKGGQLDGSNIGPEGPFQQKGSQDEVLTLQGVGVRADGTLLVMRGKAYKNREGGELFRFTPDGAFLSVEGTREDGETQEVEGGAIDPRTRERYYIEGHHFNDPMVVTHEAPSGEVFETFGSGELTMPQGVALNPSTNDVYVADSGNRRIAIFGPIPDLPDAIPAATSLTPHSELLGGEVDRAGAGPITGCHVEFGKTSAYGSGPLPCETSPASSLPYNETSTSIGVEVPGLEYATIYHFHLVAENANGESASYDDTFTTLPLPPVIESVTGQAFAETALIQSNIDAGGGPTTYRVEYVTQRAFETEGGFAHAQSTPALEAGSARTGQAFTAHLNGLAQVTTYHFRLVVDNASSPVGGTIGPEHVFTTLPFVSEPIETCPNAHVRQQTSSIQLLDCRAYELVSASNSGGYDVESNLIPGQVPFAGYPEANDRVLYGIHSGGIPGTNHPTDRGVDPYVATRGAEGWSTEYVGVPADDPFAGAPFSSTPSGGAAGLETFAFGAGGGCSPCFEGGYTGVPVHLPSGQLVQGMVAAPGVPTPPPSAVPDGHIAADLSANGGHLIFGSTTSFAPGGNAGTGDVSIYDRNLQTGETHVVSNAPDGAASPEPLACLQGVGNCDSAEHDTKGISELAVSADGSHILLGQLVSEIEGKDLWHLYMDVDDAVRSIDLTPGVISAPGGPGFSEGVTFDGMTADGSKVFFTTKDAMPTAASQDTDTSADIYEAEVSESGSTLRRISTGTEGTGNTDSCDPAANTVHTHWNTTTTETDCGVVAVGGGGGVASGNGTIYFLSPEKLAGTASGVQNAPNLYVAVQGGAPRYVTTLESSANAALPPTEHPFQRAYGTFQTPAGVAVTEAPGEEGDSYVLDLTNEEAQGNVQKFNSSGALVTNFGTGGKITGVSESSPAFEEIAPVGLPTGIAVDNDPTSSSYGDLYVPNIYEEVVEKYSPTGAFLGSLSAGFASGVAVDQATGDVYVSDVGNSVVRVFDSAGTETRNFPSIPSPTGVAVAPGGTVYVVNGGGFGGEGGETEAYDSAGNPVRQIAATRSIGIAVEPQSEDVYVDEGSKVSEFDPAGDPVGGPNGASRLSGSIGLAAQNGELFVSNRGTGPETGQVAVFGTPTFPADPETDNPLVIDSVSSPEDRHTSDFQVNPSGEQAVFPSVLALAGKGEETSNHDQVFRYDAPSGVVACVSCTLSGFPSTGESSLASDGLSLTSDGRVFFDSNDHLLASDTDEKRDIYEWEPSGTGNCSPDSATFVRGDCLSLVSTGTSSFDSSLLTASSSGQDVFFFTRDDLVPQDNNGPTMKIYDARSEGGFPYELTPAGCKASDECHGAASPAPAPLEVGSEAGAPHQFEPAKACKKGFVKRHGRCVKKAHHKKAPRKHRHQEPKRKRATHHKRGGGK